MREFFKYIKEFPFKNLFALLLVYKLLAILESNPTLRDILIVLLTLIVKHYFDSNTGAEKRDATISKALGMTSSNPVVENSEVTNIKKP